ncbi:MAG: hypothetical protein H6590_01945 [Flavobacteriales bacterium]|nr:hypothetical protein [Flavobacteriales bacterium]MCB9178176.1 hypothetical protein [Flavobacteriales bacterium]
MRHLLHLFILLSGLLGTSTAVSAQVRPDQPAALSRTLPNWTAIPVESAGGPNGELLDVLRDLLSNKGTDDAQGSTSPFVRIRFGRSLSITIPRS